MTEFFERVWHRLQAASVSPQKLRDEIRRDNLASLVPFTIAPRPPAERRPPPQEAMIQ